ncbi:hypothetical protein [Leucobacter sp. GX24907]
MDETAAEHARGAETNSVPSTAGDETKDDGATGTGLTGGGPADELISTVELVESQPLYDRARGYEQLHEQLLAELQRSDGTDDALR